MAEELRSAGSPEAAAISAEAMRKAEEFIEADEGAINRLSGLTLRSAKAAGRSHLRARR